MLDEAKSRAREIHGDSTPRVLRAGITLGEVYDNWVESREIRPASVVSFAGIYRRHIADRFGRVKVREIDAGAIAAVTRPPWAIASLLLQTGRRSLAPKSPTQEGPHDHHQHAS